MTQKEKEKLKRYVKLKEIISESKEEIDELSPDVLAITESVVDETGDEVIVGSSKIVLTERRKWKFPDYVLEAEENLKSKLKEELDKIKDKAKSLGDAEYELLVGIKVTKNKNNES